MIVLTSLEALLASLVASYTYQGSSPFVSQWAAWGQFFFATSGVAMSILALCVRKNGAALALTLLALAVFAAWYPLVGAFWE